MLRGFHGILAIIHKVHEDHIGFEVIKRTGQAGEDVLIKAVGPVRGEELHNGLPPSDHLFLQKQDLIYHGIGQGEEVMKRDRI